MIYFEHHIADIYHCGRLVGTPNHSRKFTGVFSTHLYTVIRRDIKKMVVSNNLPFCVMADKMTSKHLTSHGWNPCVKISDETR